MDRLSGITATAGTLGFTLLVFSFCGPAGAAPAMLKFTSTQVSPGGQGTVALQAETDFGFQGFSVSVAYNPSALQITDMTYAGTILESIHTDFFKFNVHPEAGGFVIGVLVDSLPPFTGDMVPGIGMPLDLVKVSFSVPPGLQNQTTSLRFVDGFGSPPIQTVLSVDNQTLVPDQLVAGEVRIAGSANFIRGDANQDREIDVADPVFLLGYLFLGTTTPICMDAADGNDDETLDLSDASYLLSFNFLGGPAPRSPFPNAGRDPTGGLGGLDCKASAFSPR